MSSDEPTNNPGLAEELKRQREKLKTLRERQHILEMQSASMGLYTPPYVAIDLKQVTTEIGTLRQQIAELEAALTQAPPEISATSSGVPAQSPHPETQGRTSPATPRPTAAQLRRTALERRLDGLFEEHTAVNSRIDATLDPVDRLRLQRRADEVLAEMQKIEQELQGL